MEDTDTSPGGDTSLSVEQAAAAFVKSRAPEAAPTGQAEDEEDQQGTETDDELQASDEDEGETDDGETEDEGQADDETDDEPDSDQGRYVAKNGKVKLEDGSTVTVDDLIKGNLRDRDYRQKTMEAAEVRKTFEAQSTAVKQRESQLAEQFNYVAQLVQSIIPPEPDPAMADPNSPKFDIVGYMSAEAARKQAMGHLNYLTAEQQRVAEAAAEQAKSARTEKANREWDKALETMPEFKDPKRVEAFVKSSLAFGESHGFTREEIAEALAMDHRYLPFFDKAMKWDRLQASKANVNKKVEGRPPVSRGGKRHSSSERNASRASEALNTARKSGSVQDVTAAYIASLNKG